MRLLSSRRGFCLFQGNFLLTQKACRTLGTGTSIEATDQEIDALVYELYDLTPRKLPC